MFGIIQIYTGFAAQQKELNFLYYWFTFLLQQKYNLLIKLRGCV
jgi:hypothetical protein